MDLGRRRTCRTMFAMINQWHKPLCNHIHMDYQRYSRLSRATTHAFHDHHRHMAHQTLLEHIVRNYAKTHFDEHTEDLYKILKVPQNASKADISKAFRTLAKEYHPDVSKHPKAKELYRKITDAYDTLKNPQTRMDYDMRAKRASQRKNPFQQQTRHQQNHRARSSQQQQGKTFYRRQNPENHEEFERMFREFEKSFNMGTRQNQRRRERSWSYYPGNPFQEYDGVDIESFKNIDIEMDLADMINGKKVKVEYAKHDVCVGCHGSGQGHIHGDCHNCRGTGKVMNQFSVFRVAIHCPECGGAGVFYDTCRNCQGRGWKKQETKTRTITVPPGHYTDKSIIKVIKYAGYDAKVTGDPPTPLVIRVRTKKENVFAIDEENQLDLHGKVTVDMLTAIEGGQVEIQFPDGSSDFIAIPPGSQPDDLLKLENEGYIEERVEGFKSWTSSPKRGDLYMRIHVDLPKAPLTDRQREIVNILKFKPSNFVSGSDGQKHIEQTHRVKEGSTLSSIWEQAKHSLSGLFSKKK